MLYHLRHAQYPLLSMAAPLINEHNDDYSVDTHRKFLTEMFRRDYGKELSDCRFIVGDNCSVNKRLAGLVDVPLFRCASHCLSLAVQDLFCDYEDELGTLKMLMTKLKNLDMSAKLR